MAEGHITVIQVANVAEGQTTVIQYKCQCGRRTYYCNTNANVAEGQTTVIQVPMWQKDRLL